VAAAAKQGIEIAIVVGGGNYFRGSTAPKGLERATADYVGMLATCMNALMLQVIILRKLEGLPAPPKACAFDKPTGGHARCLSTSINELIGQRPLLASLEESLRK
jgi:hypothetical protein